MKEVGYKDLETIGWERNMFYDKPHHPLFLDPRCTKIFKAKVETIIVEREKEIEEKKEKPEKVRFRSKSLPLPRLMLPKEWQIHDNNDDEHTNQKQFYKRRHKWRPLSEIGKHRKITNFDSRYDIDLDLKPYTDIIKAR